jgi:DNA-binding MarR family transcriptional regulator
MRLSEREMVAWHTFLRAHSAVARRLDADLIAGHALTLSDYEVLLALSRAPERRLRMSQLAESALLTRSGTTRLVDGLVRSGLVERVACPTDARVAYAQLTDAGLERLRVASRTHVAGIRARFLARLDDDEQRVLAELLGRLVTGPLDDSPDCAPA